VTQTSFRHPGMQFNPRVNKALIVTSHNKHPREQTHPASKLGNTFQCLVGSIVSTGWSESNRTDRVSPWRDLIPQESVSDCSGRRTMFVELQVPRGNAPFFFSDSKKGSSLARTRVCVHGNRSTLLLVYSRHGMPKGTPPPPPPPPTVSLSLRSTHSKWRTMNHLVVFVATNHTMLMQYPRGLCRPL
jgi:hypothetical protein